MTKLWKVFKADFKSNNGDVKWKLNDWQKFDGELSMCHAGFHASPRIIDAMQYTSAEIIAQVEVRGKSEKQKDKEVWSEMRIIKAWKWEKEASVELAIFVAEQVIDIFEKEYPNDDRPRKAIEAAKIWLKNPSDSAASAAASAADSAYGAASACGAASAAHAAARAASAAYIVAARAASAAHIAAYIAADSAAYIAAKILDDCERFIQSKLERLEEIIGGNKMTGQWFSFKESFDLNFGLELILVGKWQPSSPPPRCSNPDHPNFSDDGSPFDYDISKAVISDGKHELSIPEEIVGEIDIEGELYERLMKQDPPEDPHDHYDEWVDGQMEKGRG